MEEYHKIQTVFKRDQKSRKIVEGDYSVPEFEYLQNNLWRCTEKIDGTNIRIMWDGEKVVFGGRTDRANIYAPLIERLQELFPVENMVEVFPMEDVKFDVCLYGEGYGARIQKGGGNYISDGVDFILFDVKVGPWWLKYDDVCDVATKLNIMAVPCVGTYTLLRAVKIVKDGLVSHWATPTNQFCAEGVVMKPIVDLFARSGSRIVAKIKTRDFVCGVETIKKET